MTTRHLFDTWAMGHIDNGAHGQWGTWVNGILVDTADTDGGPWGMGHMGNRAHGLQLP